MSMCPGAESRPAKLEGYSGERSDNKIRPDLEGHASEAG